MAQRPKGCSCKTMTADGYVDTSPKNVYALVISTSGATAGDMIMLRDGGATGETKIGPIWIPAAATLVSIPLGRYGVEFVTSVYYSEQVTAPNKIRVDVIYG